MELYEREGACILKLFKQIKYCKFMFHRKLSGRDVLYLKLSFTLYKEDANIVRIPL